MEVILLTDVKKLGKEGDTVKVKDGHARNYLIPRKLAAPRTAGTLKIFEAKKKKKANEAEKEKEKSAELAKKISQLSLTIPVEAGVNDALFGTVTPEMILHALRQEGMQIDKKNISLSEPIKKLGIYNAEIKLHPEVKENLRIWVVKK